MGVGFQRVKVCVFGLWHLGSVTAGCLASAGHQVVGLDVDPGVVKSLQGGEPPLFEPGLKELIEHGLAKGTLSFTSDFAEALAGADVVWVTYDTPVDENDRADVEFVCDRIRMLFRYVRPRTLILISSQIPVGTTHELEKEFAAAHPDKSISFAYSPENLRLGRAIEVFTNPDRVVIGLRSDSDEAGENTDLLTRLFGPFTERIEWMSVESAEMTKHALNAFLATSVVFINELASLCEQVQADAKEVERGLKSEMRIGPNSYLTPGAAFAGGTLARDVTFLEGIGARVQQPTLLISAVNASNLYHRRWVHRKVESLIGGMEGATVAVWGLTYKPGTNTLRRSDSVELCEWLAEKGAVVQAHDPSIDSLPDHLAAKFTLSRTPIAALQGASALVMATGWPEYKSFEAEQIVNAMRIPTVIDPNRFLETTLSRDSRIRYTAVGKF